MKRPKKWKMALLTWLCIYPLINVIYLTVMPFTSGWHPLLRTFLSTIILVPLMGVMLDVLTRKFNSWLLK